MTETTRRTPAQAAQAALRQLVVRSNPNAAGELLRDATFPAEGEFGCYTTFDVRDDAQEWTLEQREQFWSAGPEFCDPDDVHEPSPGNLAQGAEEARMGHGYTWPLGDLLIDCIWYWDGDGTLCFRVRDQDGQVLRTIGNDDCKKDYRWQEWPTGPRPDLGTVEMPCPVCGADAGQPCEPGCALAD